jgi:hypothetical protein
VVKSKLFDENTITGINNYSKGSRNKRNEETNNMHLNNDYSIKNYKKVLQRNLDFLGHSKKKKLVLFEQNNNLGLSNGKRNISSININIKKDKKNVFQNKNIINVNEILSNNSLIKNNKTNQKNKNNLSVENMQKSQSQSNFNEYNKIYNNIKKNFEYNNLKTNNNNIFIKPTNKLNDEVSNIDSEIKKNIDFVEKKNKINKNKAIIEKIYNKNNEKIMKYLSNKEKAYYILSQSKVLQLRERIIFSRATEKIRSIISIKDIMKSNDLFIKDKIKELEEKIINYNKIIETHFIPSKTAIISLNFNKKTDEDEFKNYLINNKDNIEEQDKKYYNIYIKLLFVLLEDNINEKNLENININDLYAKLIEKGYKNFKDFFYDVFISQKTKKIYDEAKMDIFNKIFEELPDCIKNPDIIRNNRFISFSYFLLHEIYNYWNELKEMRNLKEKTQKYLQCIKKKSKYFH